MSNKVLLKKSSVASKVPLTSDLDYGEMAINYTDEKLYFKNASNVIKSFSATQSTLTIGTGLSGTSYNGSSAVTIAIDSTVVTLSGSQTLTNKTLTSPVINSGSLSGTLSGGVTLSGAITISNTTASTSTSTGALTVAGGLGVAGTVYADQIRLTNNGNGTNVYVGDDVIFGDMNQANTVSIRGQQDATKGYIVFGNSNGTNYIGRDGTNPLTVTGQFKLDTGTVSGGNAIALQMIGYANKGGTGYHDFLSVTNSYPTATNINKFFRLNSTGNLEIINSAYTANIFTLSDAGVLTVPQISAGGSTGTSGQVLSSTGSGLQWVSAGGTGTVTSVSVATANGFAGSVTNATTTPAITLSTTITGLLKGNGTSISAATAGTDYASPSQTMYIGTTAVAINRASASQSLTGITSIDGYATRISDATAGLRIANPGGGSYATQTGAVTGAIKIKLPTATFKSNTMLRFTVRIYEYAGSASGTARTIEVGGYNYSDAPANWINYFATQSTMGGGDINVRFGNDGTSQCIWIGDTATAWAYPQVFITDFQAGYSNFTDALWGTGWAISFVTALDTVTQGPIIAAKDLNSQNYNVYLASPSSIGSTTPNTGAFTTLSASSTVTLSGGTANGVLYLNGSKAATSGSALTFDGTNLGIGTSSPGAKLDNRGELRTGQYQNDPVLRIISQNTAGPASTALGSLIFNVNANNIGGLTSERTAGIQVVSGTDERLTNLDFYTATVGGGTSRMRIDSSGNLGLGVTPSGWGSTYKAFNIGATGVLSAQTDYDTVYVGNNWYFNGTSNIYKSNDFASQYQQYQGKHIWYTAPSGTAGQTTTVTSGNSYNITAAGGTNYTSFGAANNNVGTTFTATSSGTGNGGGVTQNISFAQAMTLDASGNLGIGTSSGGTKLDVNGASFLRGNLSVYSATGGAVDSNLLYFGSAALVNAAAIYSHTDTATAGNLILATAQSGTGTITERMRIDSAGVVGIGTSAVAGNQDYLRIAGNTNSASDYHAFGNYSTNELYIQPNTYTNILRGYAYTSTNRKMNASDAAIKITNNSILLAYDTGNVNVGYTSDQGYKLAVNGSVSIGTIRNAAGIKTYSVSTTSQGNVNSTYEIMQISRDSANWSNGIGYEITVYNRYYRGGMTKWFVTFNQVDSGTATCISSVGTFLHKVYLGTEVIVSGTIGYRPVLVDIPNYEFVSIEVKFTSGEVSTINAADQVKFTGTYTTGTGTNYSGDTMLVPNGGNVGIGVTPSYKLDINGVVNIAPSNSSGVQQGLRLYDAGTGGSEGLYIQWESASRSDMARILAAGDSTGGYLAFNTNNANTGTSTERMRIDPTGRVLVGLTGAGTYEANTKTNLYTSGISQVFNLLQLTNQGTPGTGDIVGIGFAAGETTQYGVKGSIGFVRTSSYGLGALAFYTNNTSSTQNVSTSDERMRITSGGNVLIGTTTDGGYKLQVNGSFAATTKSFLIDHPTKEGMKLRYGSLEGPENGVYVRGRLKDNNAIELPDYWIGLVDEDSITVQLTPIGKHQKLYVEDIKDNKVYIANDRFFAGEINCFYYILAERKDVEKLEVEIY